MTETYTYDAFGTLTYIQSLNEEGVLAQTDTALSCFLYAGEQYDEVTGLYYLRARRYDTTVGRFTQEDTYLGDGRNLYVYVQNNPLKYVDPSGYCKNTGYELTDVQKMQNAAYYYADGQAAIAGQTIANLISGKIEEALNQLPPEEEQRIRDGVWNVFKGVGVIASGGAALYALPVAAPALTVASTKILAGTAIAMGSADITEGTQDIIYGSTGNAETVSFNPVRDTVFGGNQQNYDAFEFALAGSAFGTWVYYSSAFSAPLLSGNVAQYANVLGGAGEMLDNVGDAIEEVGNLFDAGINALSIPDSRILRANMIAAGIEVPEYRNAAHHIVAGASAKAAEARAILQKFGIGINDAVNGVFLPTEKGVSEAMYHPSLHTDQYYRIVTELLSQANSREEVMDILVDIAEQLLNGTFPY
ncbi:MAG: hypothetical protein E7260_07455 [Lachnospiraceae bacterium]|nr:hypothetical protein [Lachnospiraceae bacterium]